MLSRMKAKGAFVSEDALHIWMAVSRILSWMIIYLARPAEAWRTSGESSFAMMRRYPRIKRTGCPPSVLSCTAWGFSCLANCSASGELLPRLFTLACASFKEPAVSFL